MSARDGDEITTERDLFWASVKQEAEVDKDAMTDTRPAFSAVYIKHEPADCDEVLTLARGNTILLPQAFVDTRTLESEQDQDDPWRRAQQEILEQQDPLQLPDVDGMTRAMVDECQPRLAACVATLSVKQETHNQREYQPQVRPDEPDNVKNLLAAEQPPLPRNASKKKRCCLYPGPAEGENMAERLRATVFECDICRAVFSKKLLLRQHVATHEYTCYHSAACLSRAKQLHGGGGDIKPHCSSARGELFAGEAPSCCAQLGNELLAAGRRLSPARPHACPYCDYACATRSNLKCHVRRHTGERPHVCLLCGARFTTSSHLKTHTLVHEGVKPHACPQCALRFSFVSKLKLHILTHTGEKRHVCPDCGSRYATKGTLRTHRLAHEGRKPFACRLCEYRCTTGGHLARHVRTHTGEKPHVCTVCGFRSSERRNLTQHMFRHTGEKPYACHRCDYRSASRSNLNQHLTKHNALEADTARS